MRCRSSRGARAWHLFDQAIRRAMRSTSISPAMRPALESLERRTLLTASDPIISEFMADNTNGLVDGLGHRGDWIEIYNPNSNTFYSYGID